MTDVPFLRSINIAQDATHPERVMHFRPTAKCVGLIDKLLGEQLERAYFVVSPYGSGKSLACTYLLHLIENSRLPAARALLKTVNGRLKNVDPKLAEFAQKRTTSKRRGLVLVLEGNHTSVAEALKSAAVTAMQRCKLGREAKSIEKIDVMKPGAIVELISLVSQKSKAAKLDRVVILWDEFGRHLEGLVSTGRVTELAEVQLLAETVSRISTIPVTLGVIMHQGFANYAGALPQALQAEWKKVEGRFSPIQYIDDSVELYELLGTIVSSIRPNNSPTKISWPRLAKAAQAAGLFASISPTKLAPLLEATWPFDPASIHLLPRLAARTAQNERTMFSFLYSRTLNTEVNTDELYEYFAPTMELDRGVGGTYRTWLETESACAKADTPLEVSLLRLTSLLGLALSEDRGRLTQPMLEQTASLGNIDLKSVKAATKTLLSRKLLLHRRHANQISLWHGTDIDLRGRIETERAKLLADFSLVEFLSEEFPPPVWKPVRYNDEMAIRRFFRTRFVAAFELPQKLEELSVLGGLAPDSDGEIWYVITKKDTDFATAIDTYVTSNSDKRLVLVVPKTPANLTEPAVELLALQRLLLDEELVSADPLAINEIGQMIDDVHKYISRLVDQIVIPRPDGAQWLHQETHLEIKNSKALREALSRITEVVYHETPRINSEMVARQKPSATIVNSRKKLCLGILERYGQEKLGLEGEFADSAIFRSVLLGTGLYCLDQQGSTWRFARPDELVDPNLKAVWHYFENFFTEASKTPKRISSLFDPLLLPPIGLRRGLFPILFAAAVRTFPNAASITRHDGSYISDLLPSEVEAICKEPHKFYLFVPPLSDTNLTLLQKLRALFQTETTGNTADSNLIRDTHEAIEDWVHTLPRGALTSRLVSSGCRQFQKALRTIENPQRLLLKDLPELGGPSLKPEERAHEISLYKEEIEGVGVLYSQETSKLIARTLDDGLSKDGLSALGALSAWLAVLPEHLLDSLRTPNTKFFLSTLKVGFTSEAVAIEKIAVACTGRTFQHWTDETVREFHEIFLRNVNEIESELVQNSDGSSEAVKTFILRSRINRLTTALAEVVGDSEANKYLSSIAKKLNIKTRSKDGHHSRRTGNN